MEYEIPMLMFVDLEMSEQWWELLPYLMLSRTHRWLKQIHVVTIVPTRNNYRSVRIRIKVTRKREPCYRPFGLVSSPHKKNLQIAQGLRD